MGCQFGGGRKSMRTQLINLLKMVLYNLLVFFVVGNVLYWSLPTVAAISSLFKQEEIASPYHSFIGWRLSETKSPDFNIEGPYSTRRTINAAASDGKGEKIYF